MFDPHAPEFRLDPYPFYRRLREEAPVYRHPSGYWLLTRYADCKRALEDEHWGYTDDYGCLPDSGGRTSSAAVPGPRSTVVPGRQDVPGDPARSDYAHSRRLVGRALTTSVIRQLEAKVQRLVDDHLDRALEQGEVNLVEAFAYPLAAVVFCELFGVPPSDRAVFREWVDAIVRGVDSLFTISAGETARRDQATAEFSAYFRTLLAKRRAQPRDDLLGALVSMADSGLLDEEEVVATCVLLLIAGHESTANLIGNAVLALVRHPEELERLRADPGIARSAVEEFLRYDSPAQFAVRTVRMPVELDGQRLAEGDLTIVFLAAANRDPAVFAFPDRLDLTREPNRHLSFGHGGHVCLGATLARMESRIALGTLVRRAREIRLCGEPEYKPTFELRGLAKLPVRLSPA